MAKKKTVKKEPVVFAKGTYIMAGSSQTKIKDEVNRNTPDHMIPSVPKPVSAKSATNMIQKKTGGFKKKFDWTRGPRITKKMPRLR